jgi:hypothetical protein
MGCSKCKKQERLDELKKSSEYINNGVVIFVIIWSLFAVYGVYSLIENFI